MRIIKELPDLVTAIRAAGLGTVHEEDMYFRPELRAHFDRLGVTSAYCHGELGSGNVYFTLDGDGGAVDSLGKASRAGLVSSSLRRDGRTSSAS